MYFNNVIEIREFGYKYLVPTTPIKTETHELSCKLSQNKETNVVIFNGILTYYRLS